MGRRADHTREELIELILIEGAALVESEGFGAFSARKLALRIGYAVSTVLHVMGSPDAILMAINTRTFSLWTAQIEKALKNRQSGRLDVLVNAYFDFAGRNPRLWMAIYDHHLPAGMTIPPDQQEVRGRLVDLITKEVAFALPKEKRSVAPQLARSLIATVHGHCHMWLSGSMDLMGEADPRGHALARVMDTMKQAAI